ncbi:MAG: ATP-binding cassette domain-containing protein [Crocinitomicaceae bacterium]
MSERILRALMQLFAILARVDESEESLSAVKFESKEGRLLVEDYLRSELNTYLVDFYLRIFDNDLQTLHQSTFKKDGKRKRTSVNSVKILRICSQINKELTQSQKVLVLIRIIEFVYVNRNRSKQELDFLDTVADSFNIDKETYDRLTSFIENDLHVHADDANILYVTNHLLDFSESKSLALSNLDAEIRILRISSINSLIFKYLGSDQLLLNGQVIPNQRVQVFSNGASLKTAKSNQLYYSDVISYFLNNQAAQKIEFNASNLSYRFPNDNMGLHLLDFHTESGKLIGIMGGSGSGKSTLINILNGNIKPTTGEIEINGTNLYSDSEKLEGIIGYISQDDVLLEELTVYQNLLFNAQLCFRDLDEISIHKKVLKILHDVGLHEIKNLKVGSVEEKVISGGQRKRLNIALELIREPAILFVDEPTSGLSSRDSENIMDLMKMLTLQGKLIFVVIHQPSSEIFKMFDRLLLLDKGGYPIYDGNPLDSIVYFKIHVNHVNCEVRECPECGNVNPEQIFNIIESKVVNEKGNLTNLRKTEPEEWFEKYKNEKVAIQSSDKTEELVGESKKPSKFKQFSVFFLRDAYSKVQNNQYLVVNFLEAPFLAIFLAFVLRYFGSEGKNQQDVYSFYHNDNVPQYIFISVIVALFMGLTVSAEEIFRDRRILKRERFLNLSKSSYLLSKVAILFLISAIQTLTFTLVGNSIMEVKGLWLEYWFILFTVSCFANLLGLIISSAFNSVKVIYIVVPLLIIPQLLFSGIMVKFDKLHPAVASQKSVPWIGNIMASRWAFEALAVEQLRSNPINDLLFEYKIEKSESAWKRDYWIPEMLEQLSTLEKENSSSKAYQNAREILINEIQKEESKWTNFACEDCVSGLEKEGNYLNIKLFISKLRLQYIKEYERSVNHIDNVIAKIGEEEFNQLQNDYINEDLRNLVTNRSEMNKLIVYKGELIQKVDQVFQDSKMNGFWNVQLYTPFKYFLGFRIATYWANLIVLWSICAFVYLALYFDWLNKILKSFKFLRRKKTTL